MRRGAERKPGGWKREKRAMTNWSLGATSGPAGVVGADHAPPPPRLFPGPQPSLSPAEQHLESPVPSAPGALAGGPTQAAPGVRGEEEQWAREIGAQLRRMADDLNALYERRVSAGGGVDGRWDFPPGRGLRAGPARCAAAAARRGGARRLWGKVEESAGLGGPGGMGELPAGPGHPRAHTCHGVRAFTGPGAGEAGARRSGAWRQGCSRRGGGGVQPS